MAADLAIYHLVDIVSSIEDDLILTGESIKRLHNCMLGLESLSTSELIESAILFLASGHHLRGSSVIHENGFKKISLFKDPISQMQLRLQFWPPGSKDGSIHDHRWNYISTVVHGSVFHSIFQVEPPKGEKDFKMIELSDADSSLIKTASHSKDVNFREISRTMLNRGCIYAHESSSFHQLHTFGGAITLMATGRPVKSFTNVIRTTSNGGVRRAISPEECISFLRSNL